MDCDTCLLALDQQRRGELAPGERPALDQHLAGCARCREEDARAAALAQELAAELEPAADRGPPAGWDDLAARIARAERSRRRDLIKGATAAAAAGIALVFGRGQATGVTFDPFGAGLAAGVGVALLLVAARGWVTSQRAALPGTDLLETLRGDLRRRLRALRFFAIVSPAYALAGAAQGKLWGQGPAGLALRIALVAAMTLLALHGWLRVRPRLVRELADLERH